MDNPTRMADHEVMGMAGVATVAPRRWVHGAAWGVFAVDFVAAAIGAALLAVTGFEAAAFVGASLGGLGLAIVGSVVVTRRGPTATGWLLLAIGSGVLVSMVFRQGAWFAYVEQGSTLATARALYLASDVSFSLWLPLQLLLFFTFPDGRLPSARWRPVMVLLGLVAATATATVVVAARYVRDPQ